ncbi:MAG: Hsp20/alpha crystallin family protein [Candidatus Cloacimonadaceae bacterium]
MKLVPYNRNTEFKPMMSMLNLFDDFFNRYYEEDSGNDFKAMAMDIVEQEKEFELMANLPGFKKEDVKISVHDNQLLIEAKCENKKEEKKGTMYRCERYSGNYRRNLYLPENADVAKIQAKMEDGVLKLSIPKKEAAPQKEIVIE